MNEMKSVHAAEDWSVVLQSVPSKNKKVVVKRLEEIFELDKHDAEQVLSNVPLILVDNLSFELAMSIKKFFQKQGVVAETTNHEMIKKNCFQVLWPRTPDLSFFMKSETASAETSVQAKMNNVKPAEIPLAGKKTTTHEAPLLAEPAHETAAVIPQTPPISPKPAQEPPAIVSNLHPVSEEKPEEALSPGVKSDWERRAGELNEKLQKIHEEKLKLHAQHAEVTEKIKNEFQQKLEEERKKSDEIAARAHEKLRKIHEEKQELHEQHAETAEKVKNEFQQQLEEERKKSGEIAAKANEKLQKIHEEKLKLHAQHAEAAEKMKNEFQQQLEEEMKKSNEIAAKANEDLQKEVQRQEALIREGEEWRSRVMALDEKVRELETDLMQKTAAIEYLTQQKNELIKIHEEKQKLHEQHAEAAEKVKNEFEQQLNEERKKNGEIAKTNEDLQKEVQRQEVLIREGEEWHSRVITLDEKVRELETDLMQKTTAIVDLTQQKDELIKIHEEKLKLHAQRAEAAEKMKNEFQQQLEEEMKKSSEIAAKANEDIQREAQKQEALIREGEEWHSRVMALDEKVRELEADLMQKTSAVEYLTQQKNELIKIHEGKQKLYAQRAEAAEKVKNEFEQQLNEERKKNGEIAKTNEDLQKEVQRQEVLIREGEEWHSRVITLDEKVRELETDLMQKTTAIVDLTQQKDELIRNSEKAASEAQHELSTLRGHEQELSRKIEGMEQTVQEMTESLQSRNAALAQFEKQIVDLAEKAREHELLRQEYAQERVTIRQECDAKLAEQEARVARSEEDHRRYRSRTDRKNAAATRELGEWIRGVDTIRQGLQKMVLFLGSESTVLDGERKSNLRSPLTRGPDAPNTEKN